MVRWEVIKMFGGLSRLFGKVGKREALSTLANAGYKGEVGVSLLNDLTRGQVVNTSKSKFGDALVKASDLGLNAPISLTRKDMRDIGPSAYEVSGRLFDRTGLSNTDKLRILGKELTGGDNSYLDEVTNNLRTDFGRNNLVNVDELMPDIRNIRDNMTDKLSRDLFDKADVTKKANMLKASAETLRKSATPSAFDKAKANYFYDVGQKLDDLIDSRIDSKTIDQVFGSAAEEMKFRAAKYASQNDKDMYNAYLKLADEFENVPVEERTIAKLRNMKKDFVDLSEIGKRSDRSKNGGSFARKINQVPVIGPVLDSIFAQPVEAMSQKIGATTRNIGRQLQTGELQPKLKTAAMYGAGGLGALTLLGAGGGGGQDGVTPPVEGEVINPAMAGAMGAGMTGSISEPGGDGTGGMSPMGNVMPDTGVTVAGYNRDQLEQAYLAALMDDNLKAAEAIGTMLEMLDDKEGAMAKAQESAGGETDGKTQAALNIVGNLERIYNEFGGAKGVISGNITNALNSISGGGFNADVGAYDDLVAGSLAPIIKAMGDSGNLSDSDVQRAYRLVPQVTDDPKKAQKKFTELKAMLAGASGVRS